MSLSITVGRSNGEAVAIKIHPVFVTLPNPKISSQLTVNILKVNTVHC